MPSDASRRLHQRALRSIPTGTHSNSRVASPHPLYFASASGATLVDVDGRRWTDYVMGNGAVILGHGDEHVTEATTAALREGLGAGVESELAIVAAEAFLRMVPTADRVRFTNTGTEAIMHAVHIARAVTGRASLAKIEGAYHGWWDEVFVSTWPDPARAGDATRPRALPGSPGLRGNIVEATVVVPFNDLEATRRILSERQDVAALVIEPVMIDIGYVEPDPGYLAGLRDLTKSLGIVLIFDELLTGFRVHTGGVQGRDGVVPDLSTWGKALANGFPIAALAGTAEMMARSEPGAGNAAFVGTFNGYRPALAACVATLERLADGRVIADLQRRSRAFAEAFEAVGKAAGVPVRLHTGGGHFQPYFTETPVRDYRSAATTDAGRYDRWRTGLERRGAIVASKALLHCAFSAAHTDDHLSALLDATRDALTTKEPHHA
jgi:glutamate-1-semialdehyde 2,1-aminomutase